MKVKTITELPENRLNPISREALARSVLIPEKRDYDLAARIRADDSWDVILVNTAVIT